jgi:uncharacterized membrane protein
MTFSFGGVYKSTLYTGFRPAFACALPGFKGKGYALPSFIRKVAIYSSMKWFLALVMVLAMLPSAASAATIHGNVYDMSLQKASAMVSVDTVPRQQSVAVDGSYSFEVPEGSYTLSASTVSGDQKAEEALVVESEGDYTLDLILFPTFEEEQALIEEAEGFSMDEAPPADYSVLILSGIIVIIIALAFIGQRLRKLKPVQPKPLSHDLDRAVRYIRQHGGRVNQKDLRKEFNLSEAKISLMVTEMESMGLVKKGRGNIIVLQ